MSITGYASYGVIEDIVRRRIEMGITRQPEVTRTGDKRGCETNGIGYKTVKHLNLDIDAAGRLSPWSPSLARKMRDFPEVDR